MHSGTMAAKYGSKHICVTFFRLFLSERVKTLGKGLDKKGHIYWEFEGKQWNLIYHHK